MDGGLLEREDQLATLMRAADAASVGDGSVVVVAGEAGIGKSALVRAFAAARPPGLRWLIGWCDDLATARVLGPLRDLAADVGDPLASALETGDRGAVGDALLRELTSGGPAVVVIEDLHWADEASLDVLRFLVRRIENLPVALVLTHRDDELGPEHPLRPLLGVLSRLPRLRRLRLPRLSLASVRALSSAEGRDPERVFGVTAGNPYFVTEVLGSGDTDGVPLTIADSVHARLLNLDAATRIAVETLAVVPSAVERWLVDTVVAGGIPALAAAEHNGILHIDPDRVGFRHELTRLAVVDTMLSARRTHAHGRVLDALLERDADVSRIVHHAAGAGRRDVLLDHGPRAARQAITAGAHRQAVAHLALVLDQQPELPPAQLAELWERFGVECYTTSPRGQVARDALERAVSLRRGGDPLPLATSLRWLSRIAWWQGDVTGAMAAGDEAITVLAGTGHDAELAMLFSNQSQLHALAGRDAEAIALGERALALGGHVPTVRTHALNNLGVAHSRTSYAAARPLLLESLAVAHEAGDSEQTCRAYVNLIWTDLENLRLDDVDASVREGFAHAETAEFITFANYLQLEQAWLAGLRGQWDRVVDLAGAALDGTRPFRAAALTIIGQLRARQGAAGAEDLLDEAWDIAIDVGECQRVAPAACAIGEAAELAGQPGAALGRLRAAYDLAERFGTEPVRAELAYRLRRAGETVPIPTGDHPYAALAQGDWRRAYERWRAAQCPYESAVALSHSSDPDDLRTALGVLDDLGAAPLAAAVRARLRLLGVTAVPRGPIGATRTNPAGLTDRQLDVVRLLADGSTNAEIAARLVLSVRTVDSHVAAAFAKLGAHSRRDAVARAAELGIAPP